MIIEPVSGYSFEVLTKDGVTVQLFAYKQEEGGGWKVNDDMGAYSMVVPYGFGTRKQAAEEAADRVARVPSEEFFRKMEEIKERKAKFTRKEAAAHA